MDPSREKAASETGPPARPAKPKSIAAEPTRDHRGAASADDALRANAAATKIVAGSFPLIDQKGRPLRRRPPVTERLEFFALRSERPVSN